MLIPRHVISTLGLHARRFSTMEITTRSSGFTQQVVKAMQTLYPLELADRAWDNVGLLLDNDEDGSTSQGSSTKTVLLTNDLTPPVAAEAIAKKASVIVTYHPFIFRGLKSITHTDPQQSTLIRLARANIAVYSPHTAVDAAPGGVNDFLAGLFKSASPEVTVVQPVAHPTVQNAGYGRLVRFRTAMPFKTVLERVGAGLGLEYVSVAQPIVHRQKQEGESGGVRSVAVCAGSGWDVLKDCDADVIVTGEISHHSALMATMRGQYVVTVFHSNSERAFIRKDMKAQLQDQLAKDGVEGSQVLVSEEDRDPFVVAAIT